MNNPERQGLQSALLGEGDPLNVTQEEPGFEDGVVLYSPMWDIHLVVWTDAAIAAGERRRLTDAEEEIVALFEAGLVVSGDPAGMPNASLGGLRAINAISNCPISINLGPPPPNRVCPLGPRGYRDQTVGGFGAITPTTADRLISGCTAARSRSDDAVLSIDCRPHHRPQCRARGTGRGAA
ncbi:MAG: hypothetical protein M3545_15015 [Acidobacteriota bacterium]|nr:hypothetical protein [Acidobacteriota bacterium]